MQSGIAISAAHIALDRLRRANERVILGHLQGPSNDAGPTAVILSCSECDPTRFFDLPHWQLSVVQTPAQALVEGTVASIAFSLLNDHAELVLVLGHTHCRVLERAFGEGSIPVIRQIMSAGSPEEQATSRETHAELHAKRIARKLAFALTETFHTGGRIPLIVSAVGDVYSRRVHFDLSEAR